MITRFNKYRQISPEVEYLIIFKLSILNKACSKIDSNNVIFICQNALESEM